MRFSWKQDSKTLIMVVIASVIMAVNINTFVLTGGLYPGGVTGLTLLIQRFGEASLASICPSRSSISF